MNRIKKLKFNLKVVYLMVAFISVVSIIFSLISIRYVNNNMLKDEKNELLANSTIINNNILKKIETIDLIGSYIIDDNYLNTYLKKAYDNKLTLDDKLEFLDSNLSGLEGVININENIDYIRVYSTNNQITELLPSFYSSSRIENLKLSEDGWLVNYQNNIFSNDKPLVGNFYNIYNEGKKIAIVEIAINSENIFYENNFDKTNTVIYNQGFLTPESDPIADILTSEDLIDNEIITKDNYLLTINYLSEIDSYIINYKDLDNINKSISQMIIMIIIAIFFIVLFLVLIINYIIKKLFKRFYLVLDGISEISKGNLDNLIKVDGSDEITELAIEINSLTESFKQMMQRNIEIEVSDKESRIKALQSQINAHFIYNTLESIKMMAEIEGMYDISDALTSLGKLLRYSMKWSSGLVVLDSEINYIKSYLALAELRFDFAINFEVDFDPQIAEQVIPKMTLQPIIENSIIYASEDNDLKILLRGYYLDNDCILEVTDFGNGMDLDKVISLQNKIENGYNPDAKGSGIALVNIHRRIKVQFGDKYGLKVESVKGEYTKIIINLPATRRN